MLAGAIFQNSDLRDSSVRGAFFQGAHLEHSTIAVSVPFMFRVMDFKGADLSCAFINLLKVQKYDSSGRELYEFLTKTEVEKILVDAGVKIDGALIYGEQKPTRPGQRCVNGRLQPI